MKHGIVLLICLALTSSVNAANINDEAKNLAPLPGVCSVHSLIRNPTVAVIGNNIAPLPGKNIEKAVISNNSQIDQNKPKKKEKKASKQKVTTVNEFPKNNIAGNKQPASDKKTLTTVKNSNEISLEKNKVISEKTVKPASTVENKEPPVSKKQPINNESNNKDTHNIAKTEAKENKSKEIIVLNNQAKDKDNESSAKTQPTPEVSVKNSQTLQNAVNQNQEVKQLNVLVNKIDVEGYQILSDEDIHSVTSKYEGKYLTLEEIKKVPDEINDVYKNYKILTAIAYLPPQDIDNNTVKIKVIEGRVGKISVVGNKNTNTTYLKNVLKQKEGDIIFVPEIEQEIINFNKNNDVRLSASIKKGAEFGTTDIILNLKENNPYHIGLNFDNEGTSNTGLYKTGINLQNDSVLGFRDRLMTGFDIARGTNSIYSVYDVPLGYSGLRLGGIFSKGNSSVIEGLYKDYNIEAKTTNYSVYLSKPILNSRKFYLDTNASLNFKKSKTYMLGVPIEELGGDPTSRITTTKLSLTSVLNDQYGQWSHNSSVHLGMSALGGHETFTKYTGNLQRTTFLGRNCMLILRGSTQLSAKELPALEKFQVGGVDSVHGYPEAYSVGDVGYVFNTEFRYPLIFLPQRIWNFELRKRFQGVVFMDMGRSYSKNKLSPDVNKLMGVGTGVRIRLSKYLSGRIDYSYGLINVDEGVNPSRINFQINSNPF